MQDAENVAEDAIKGLKARHDRGREGFGIAELADAAQGGCTIVQSNRPIAASEPARVGLGLRGNQVEWAETRAGSGSWAMPECSWLNGPRQDSRARASGSVLPLAGAARRGR